MNPGKKPMRILVTDAHELAGLGALRSIGRAGHRVVAGYPRHQSVPPAARSRWCAAAVAYPDPWKHNFEFRDWLLERCRAGEFDAVLPITEASIVATAAVRGSLPAGVVAILPIDQPLKYSLSKYHANRAAQQAGLALPPTVFLSDGEGGWTTDTGPLRFPIVFKIDNRLSRDGRYVKGRTFIAANAAEAEAVLREYETIRPGIIAQEFIEGRGSGAFLLRWGGKTHLSFAHYRLHEVPWQGGYSSLRLSTHDEALTRQSGRLLEAIDYEGVAMVEFRRGAADGVDYFMEVNGRLWGSLALALHCGVDFPAALLDCYLEGAPGPSRSRGEYRDGVRCRNTLPGELDYVVSVLKSRDDAAAPSKAGAVLEFVALTLNPFVRSDFLWLSDPLPWFAQAARVGRDYAGRVRASLQHRRQTREGASILEAQRRRHAEHRGHPGYFAKPPQSILFLCYGNICRSPMAEFYWNKLLAGHSLESPPAASAGFFPQAGRRTPSRFAGLLRNMGLDLSEHRSRIAAPEMIDTAGAIFVMDVENLQDLLRRAPEAAEKTWLLGLFAEDGKIELDDPYLLPPLDAYSSYRRLQRAVENLFKTICGESIPQELSGSQKSRDQG